VNQFDSFFGILIEGNVVRSSFIARKQKWRSINLILGDFLLDPFIGSFLAAKDQIISGRIVIIASLGQIRLLLLNHNFKSRREIFNIFFEERGLVSDNGLL
jgi:hypothetical protein